MKRNLILGFFVLAAAFGGFLTISSCGTNSSSPTNITTFYGAGR